MQPLLAEGQEKTLRQMNGKQSPTPVPVLPFVISCISTEQSPGMRRGGGRSYHFFVISQSKGKRNLQESAGSREQDRIRRRNASWRIKFPPEPECNLELHQMHDKRYVCLLILSSAHCLPDRAANNGLRRHTADRETRAAGRHHNPSSRCPHHRPIHHTLFK